MKKEKENNSAKEEMLENNKKSLSNEGKVTEDLKKQLLMVSSDFQNFKRRVEKEKLEWMDFSKITVIESFLPFMDDLERAIDTCKKQDIKKEQLAWIEGFELIYKNLKKIFNDLGITEIDCNKKFDPDIHEALMQVDSKDHASGEIVQIFNKGFMFKDKVIRHAKVSVAK